MNEVPWLLSDDTAKNEKCMFACVCVCVYREKEEKEMWQHVN